MWSQYTMYEHFISVCHLISYQNVDANKDDLIEHQLRISVFVVSVVFIKNFMVFRHMSDFFFSFSFFFVTHFFSGYGFSLITSANLAREQQKCPQGEHTFKIELTKTFCHHIICSINKYFYFIHWSLQIVLFIHLQGVSSATLHCHR